jgi:prepilin-type N-terminal cleavage/methylation domain-containing protein
MSVRAVRKSAGFTLIEALVAMAILSLVVIHFLGTRTEAMIDAAEAQNWRIARELAERYLSQIKAGANEFRPENREMLDVEENPGFRYQVLIGEAAIADVESEIAGAEDYNASTSDYRQSDRIAWQQEREQLRRARSAGLTMDEYEDQLLEEERLEDQIPSDTELEDVAVVVFFPNVRPSEDDSEPESSFMLKAKISTMAIHGLTPEQAEIIATERGEGTDAGTDPLDGGR